MPFRCAEELVEKYVSSSNVVGLGTGVLVSDCSTCLASARPCMNGKWLDSKC